MKTRARTEGIFPFALALLIYHLLRMGVFIRVSPSLIFSHSENISYSCGVYHIAKAIYHTCGAGISFPTPHPPQAVPLLPPEKAFLSYFRKSENISYSSEYIISTKAIYHTCGASISFPRVSFPYTLPKRHSNSLWF